MAFIDGDNGENFLTIMGLKQFTNMKKEIKITPPEGYEIDKENSTFECIKFKPIVKKKWRYSNPKITGFYLGSSGVEDYFFPNSEWDDGNRNVFATEKQAKSAFAMAQISQIMANDERFGGIVTDEEWDEDNLRYVIFRRGNSIASSCNLEIHRFLAFHTDEQRDLFLEENEDLVKDYLMID